MTDDWGPRGPALSVSTTTTVTQDYHVSVKVLAEDEQTLRERIRDARHELHELKVEEKEEERACRRISQIIDETKACLRENRQSLEESLNWPNTLLTTSQKWLDIWESDFGKKMLNARSAKTAENAILIAAVTQQVEYAREWIAKLRERKAKHEQTGGRILARMEDDSTTLEHEIHGLRRECVDWEKRTAFNRARTCEMLESHRSLERTVDEKEMLVTEIKNDINEFERELMAISYTLDQYMFV